MKKRIGLFFGSFNPLHNGHLGVAGHMLYANLVDELWLVVSPHNPFKSLDALADARERVRVAEVVVTSLGDDRFRVSDVELSLPRPSYTIRTLEELEKLHPEADFSLVMGFDTLLGVPQWKEGTRILERYAFLVYPRGEAQELPSGLRENTRIHVVEAPLLSVSSSFIREGLSAGKNMRYWLPLLPAGMPFETA